MRGDDIVKEYEYEIFNAVQNAGLCTEVELVETLSPKRVLGGSKAQRGLDRLAFHSGQHEFLGRVILLLCTRGVK